MEINIGPNYLLEKKIGKGAFGEVYEGNCINRKLIGKRKSDNQIIAVKLVYRLVKV